MLYKAQYLVVQDERTKLPAYMCYSYFPHTVSCRASKVLVATCILCIKGSVSCFAYSSQCSTTQVQGNVQTCLRHISIAF